MGYGMGERSKFEIEFKDNLYGMSRFIEDSSDEKMDIFLRDSREKGGVLWMNINFNIVCNELNLYVSF